MVLGNQEQFKPAKLGQVDLSSYVLCLVRLSSRICVHSRVLLLRNLQDRLWSCNSQELFAMHTVGCAHMHAQRGPNLFFFFSSAAVKNYLATMAW